MSIFNFAPDTKLVNFVEAAGPLGTFCTLVEGTTNKYETGIYGGFYYKNYEKSTNNGSIIHRFWFETAAGEKAEYAIFEPSDLSKIDARRAALILSDLAYFGRMFVPNATDEHFLRNYDNFEQMISHCVFSLMTAAFNNPKGAIVPEFHFKMVFQKAEQEFPYTRIAMDKPNMATFVNGQPYYGVLENIKYGPKDFKVCTLIDKKATQQPSTFTGSPLPAMPSGGAMPTMPTAQPAQVATMPSVAPAVMSGQMPSLNNPNTMGVQNPNPAVPTQVTQAPSMPTPNQAPAIPTIAPAQEAGAPVPNVAPNPVFPNFG